MAGFSDYKNALAMRDLLQRLSAEEIAKQRPAYKYGTVVSVNASARTADVLIPGDPSEVTLPFGLIAVPTGAGQIVRIDGLLGDRFISDVLTPYVPVVETVKLIGTAGNPAFANSWVNYESGHINAGFYKDPEGIVYLQGLIKNGVVTSGTTLFTLPVGYRPNRAVHFVTLSNAAAAYIYVSIAGEVQIAAGASATWLNLSGLSFVAEDVTLGDKFEGDWVTIPQNPGVSWTWYEAGDPYYTPALRRRSDGLIIVRGFVNGAGGAGVISHLVPAEYIPAKAVLTPTLGRTAPTSGQISTRLDINPRGWISSAKTVDNFALDNVRYFDRTASDGWLPLKNLLVNGWVTYRTQDVYNRMAERFQAPGYRKDKYGRVWLRGMIASGTIASGTTMFTLPSGYWPPARSMFITEAGNPLMARVDVGVTGAAQINATADAFTNAYVSLDGISFLAA